MEGVSALDSTGYIATIAGDHDLMVDAFCRDVRHLNEVLHDEISSLDGVSSVTSYLVTEIKYDSRLNLVSLMDNVPPAGPKLRNNGQ